MKPKPFTTQAREAFIDENLENSFVTDYRDPRLKGVETHFYDELEDVEINASFPFASDLVDEDGEVHTYEKYLKLPEEKKKSCRLRYSYMPNYHELYVGTTGSGKTTGCIEPQLRAICKQKNKPNVFVTDPKGEIFDHNARFLKEEGYNVFVINFKDFSKTDCWNPLLEIYEAAVAINEVGKGHRYVKGRVPDSLEKVANCGDFEGGYYEYKGKAFATKEDIDRFLAVETYIAQSHVSTLTNQFATAILPTKSTKEPAWEEGARGFLFGIIMGMAEDAANPRKGMTAERFTIKTIYDIFNVLRLSVLPHTPMETQTMAARFLEGKSKLVCDKIDTVLHSADGTRKGYFSTFDSRLVGWFQYHIYTLTAATTIDISSDEKPFAIFVATRDYEKSDFEIAGIFIDWVYRQTLIKAEASPKDERNMPTTRDVHFLLDEFGNIPAIPSFENKIATARSRKIWFHLIVQSYEQIELVYGKETAPVIIDNCNQQTFLGSQSFATKKRFSEECGRRSVENLDAMLTTQGRVNNNLQEVAVVPISRLDLIKPGELYAKRIYTPAIKSAFIRSYNASEIGYYAHFKDPNAIRDIAPLNLIVADDAEHTYLMVAKPGNSYISKVKPAQDDDEEEDDDEKKPTPRKPGGLDMDIDVEDMLRRLRNKRK